MEKFSLFFLSIFNFNFCCLTRNCFVIYETKSSWSKILYNKKHKMSLKFQKLNAILNPHNNNLKYFLNINKIQRVN